ncbi:stage II sporulation protein P [Blautia sp. HCP28S3_G10]|uniref:stage II sporulation protein P n=1 Tax=Blautia sp. HCP28S3_G10 TaxID=3438908 RepID=UPI003F8B1C35
MTKNQKAVCMGLCLCFLAVMAVMPDMFLFFSEKNIYRQLPLYCFLQSRASDEKQRRDQETYELIMENNEKYLGDMIIQENEKSGEVKSGDRPSEEAQTTVTPVPEEIQTTVTPVPEEIRITVTSVPEKNQATETPVPETSEEPEAETVLAEIQPAPAIDLAPETLADTDYLMNHFFIVDPTTSAESRKLNAADFLAEDFSFEKDPKVPQILIYHSHTQETFADSREGEEEDTIVGVGEYLAEILTEQYGYQVMHIKETFDLMGGELDRSKAYDYARDYLEPLLAENPEIQVVIDLHRDGVPDEKHLVTEINGKSTAQILFYNGLSYTNRSGNLDYLPNPYIEDNLAFSFQLEYQAAEYYPDFYRGIYLAGYRYNLHMRPKSLLLEAGAQNNTVEEVKNAMEPFADILNRVLQKQ